MISVEMFMMTLQVASGKSVFSRDVNDDDVSSFRE